MIITIAIVCLLFILSHIVFRQYETNVEAFDEDEIFNAIKYYK